MAESSFTCQTMQDISITTDLQSDNYDRMTQEDNEEEKERDPNYYEERFRVDRRKLEQMIQGDYGEEESAEEFFIRVMEQTSTHITWPSKLKIGAKSKKDPHIKVAGTRETVQAAKERIMAILDTKSTRVTLKMDVSHTEHSHVIGKGGNNIKRVMQETGCHIHFPDSNRNTQAEKSNQVSIAGQPEGVEQARLKIRELLPLVVMMELPVIGQSLPDPSSQPIKLIQDTYSVSVSFKQRPRTYFLTVVVRGSVDNAKGVKEAVAALAEKLAGNVGSPLPVSMQLEIAPQHHMFIMGRGGANLKHIMHSTGATVHFPDPTSTQQQIHRKGTVFITGAIDSVLLARNALIGCLPLVLMFDMKDDAELEQAQVNLLMERLDVFISIKPKPKQPSKSVIVKSIERNAAGLHDARRRLLGLTDEPLPPPTNHDPATAALSLADLGLVGPGLLPATSIFLPMSPHSPNSFVSSPRVPCLYSPTAAMVLMPAGAPSYPTPYAYSPRPAYTPCTTPQPHQTQTPSKHPSAAHQNKPHQQQQQHQQPQQQQQHQQQQQQQHQTQQEVGSSSLYSGLLSPTTAGIVDALQAAMVTKPAPAVATTSSSSSSLQYTHHQHQAQTVTRLAPPPPSHHHIQANGGIPTATAQTNGIHKPSLYSNHHHSNHNSSNELKPNNTGGMGGSSSGSSNNHHHHHLAQMTTTGNKSSTTVSDPQYLPTSNNNNIDTTKDSIVSNLTLEQLRCLQDSGLDLTNLGIQGAGSRPAQMSSSPSLLPSENHTSLSSDSNPLVQSHLDNIMSSSLGTLLVNPPSGLYDQITVSSAGNIPQQQDPQSLHYSQLTGMSRSDGESPSLLDILLPKHNNNTISSSPASSPNPSQQPPSSSADLFSSPPTTSQDFFTQQPTSAEELFRMVAAMQQQQQQQQQQHQQRVSPPPPPLSMLSQQAPPAQHYPSSAVAAGTPSVPSPPSLLSRSPPGLSLRSRSPPGLGRSAGGSPMGTSPAIPSSPIITKRAVVSFKGDDRRSSESGDSSDSSDHRAPGSNRPFKLQQPQPDQPELSNTSMLFEDSNLFDIIDYEQKKLLATKAMQKKPDGEVKFPNGIWAGLGFSKSMPGKAIREKLRSSNVRYNGPAMGTTLEEEMSGEDMKATAGGNYPWDGSSPSNSFNGGYASPRKSGYNSPLESPPSGSGSSSHSGSGGGGSWTELAELFSKLGLSKYTDLFGQQEIDLATFLTMTDNDLKELGISIFGARRKMLMAIADLNKSATLMSAAPGANNPFRDSSSVSTGGGGGAGGGALPGGPGSILPAAVPRRHHHDIASQSGRW